MQEVDDTVNTREYFEEQADDLREAAAEIYKENHTFREDDADYSEASDEC